MLAYIIRRILQVIPVLIGTSLILFLLMRVIPGDPVRLMTGERAMEPKRYEKISRDLLLDRPLHVQYVNFMKRLAHGDLGTSYQKGRKVTTILKEKYPNSIRLAFAAIIVELVIGIGVGIISAIRRYSFLDTLATLSTSLAVSIPVFWLGMMLQIIFGLTLDWLPISGMGDGSLQYYILPSITLAAVSTAYVARIMRSQLLEVNQQDYIRTAYAKGLSTSSVVMKHSFKNALIPVITFIGLDLGFLMGGAIVTETIFSWPGMGYEIYSAILQRDHPVVLGGVMVLVLAFIVINLLIDISYAFIDPRIRYGSQENS